LNRLNPCQDFQENRRKQRRGQSSWGVPVSVIRDWLVLHGTFEKFNGGHPMGYTFDWLYFNKANTFDNDYGHVIHFGWKIYNNNNGTKGFRIKKKKNERAITVSDCIYTLTVLTYRTAIDLDWLRANLYCSFESGLTFAFENAKISFFSSKVFKKSHYHIIDITKSV